MKNLLTTILLLTITFLSYSQSTSLVISNSNSCTIAVTPVKLTPNCEVIEMTTVYISSGIGNYSPPPLPPGEMYLSVKIRDGLGNTVVVADPQTISESINMNCENIPYAGVYSSIPTGGCASAAAWFINTPNTNTSTIYIW